MSAVQEHFFISADEYLNDERERKIKHELMNGHIYAMAGASANHCQLTMNIARKFGNHLEDLSCRVFSSDMKLRVNDNFFYPDVLVDCRFNDDEPYYTKSPVIIIEVLSKSTRKNDKVHKFINYINNIPSLQEYVIVEQGIVEIEVVRRSEAWVRKNYFLGDNITFESIDLTLSVEEIYHRVNNDDMVEFLILKNGQ